MKKIDKQIKTEIIKVLVKDFNISWCSPEVIDGLVSQINQSILKAIEEVRPANQDNVHYNEALDDYDNRIFNLLSEAKK